MNTSFNDREKRIGNIYGATGGSFAGMVYDSKHLSPALTTMGCGGRMPHVITKLGDIYPNPGNFKGNGRGGVYAMNGIVPTITTMTGGGNRLHTVYVSRLIPESGKIHQNQEIWGGARAMPNDKSDTLQRSSEGNGVW